MTILEKLKKIDPGFERDEEGFGYGIKNEHGGFIRIKPFWISDKEIFNNPTEKER